MRVWLGVIREPLELLFACEVYIRDRAIRFPVEHVPELDRGYRRLSRGTSARLIAAAGRSPPRILIAAVDRRGHRTPSVAGDVIPLDEAADLTALRRRWSRSSGAPATKRTPRLRLVIETLPLRRRPRRLGRGAADAVSIVSASYTVVCPYGCPGDRAEVTEFTQHSARILRRRASLFSGARTAGAMARGLSSRAGCRQCDRVSSAGRGCERRQWDCQAAR
jgi:hypothetical protein